jgi:hypothetical protein
VNTTSKKWLHYQIDQNNILVDTKKNYRGDLNYYPLQGDTSIKNNDWVILKDGTNALIKIKNIATGDVYYSFPETAVRATIIKLTSQHEATCYYVIKTTDANGQSETRYLLKWYPKHLVQSNIDPSFFDDYSDTKVSFCEHYMRVRTKNKKTYLVDIRTNSILIDSSTASDITEPFEANNHSFYVMYYKDPFQMQKNFFALGDDSNKRSHSGQKSIAPVHSKTTGK